MNLYETGRVCLIAQNISFARPAPWGFIYFHKYLRIFFSRSQLEV